MRRVTAVLFVVASLATVGLRAFGAGAIWWGRPAWLAALAIALGLLALRLGALAIAVRRGELPWSRLVLPAIFLVEGAGVCWGGGTPGWQAARLATAVALEVAFVALAIHHLRRPESSAAPLEERLAQRLARLLPPRVARLVALELVIVGGALRFLLGGWRRTDPPGFSYHRESVFRLFILMLPLMGAADVALLELVVLPRAAPWVRIVVHAAALYGLVWLIGLWASCRARPHRIDGERALLQRGVSRRVELRLDQIATVAPMPQLDDWKLRAYRKGAIRMDLGGGTVLDVWLRTPVRAVGALGPGRASDHVIVSVDDPAAFVAALGHAG